MRRVLIWLVLGGTLGVVGWSCLVHRQTITSASAITHSSQFRKPLLPQSGSLHTQQNAPIADRGKGKFAYRLTNTSQPLEKLMREPRAILLENALLDTTLGMNLPIPPNLRATSDPGSYIVQCRGTPDVAFRLTLARSGAQLTSYIPNNAYLVQCSSNAAEALASDPQVAAVLPYEPYFKIKPSLLRPVLAAQSASQDQPAIGINVLLFDKTATATLSDLSQSGIEVLFQDSSPFGTAISVRASIGQVASIARMAGVQEIEPAPPRLPANDLSRIRLGVASDSISTSNYLGLSGSNVVVNVNDLGVDATQPELAGRVSWDVPNSGVDTNGHGTHVAGIIAGSGSQSLTVTNAPGSVMPPSPLQFRGMAPAAHLFSVSIDTNSNPLVSDAYLQRTAANAKCFISNNSWHYADDPDYDLGAASYDADVRDALPSVTGSQPLLFVFAAGNSGAGNEDGTGGLPDTIQSPGTAKNVITVGAIEQPRFIANTPWLSLTDSSNQVASFSSRGNVGLGIEGIAGRFKPDVVAPGTFIVSTRSSMWDSFSHHISSDDPPALVSSPNDALALSNLDNGLGPYYRFESGTSLSAAEVSGTLALMQEFFEQGWGRTNSPALMKALLINGARSLPFGYDLHSAGATNSQGWGVVQLPNSLPPGLSDSVAQAASTWFADQSPGEALTTGQRRTRFVSLAPAAQASPLRITLAWTDPPGNLAAGVKLVNDLDLIVTNLQTGEVFWGNNIPAGTNFNAAWPASSAPANDLVNNVENVFLAPALATNYSVTVRASRVAVNALAEIPDAVVQDYALVVSSGDGLLTNALTITDSLLNSSAATLVTVLTNSFGEGNPDYGTLLVQETIGANDPMLATNFIAAPFSTNAQLTIGSPNQWHFYVFTNDTDFTNAVFLTFLPKPLSLFPAGTNGTNPNPQQIWSAPVDLDLYVSRDSSLTNLDPAAIAAADMSLGRGANEMILYSNATAGVYYIGVKCESQLGGEYGFVADFSQQPFAQTDSLGNELLRGFPEPDATTNGSPKLPAVAYSLHVTPDSFLVRRVVVTNLLSSPSLADVQLVLGRDTSSVFLLDHSGNGPAQNGPFVFDDSNQGDIAGAQKTDGPGNLGDFAGQNAEGQWLLVLVSTNQPATNLASSIFLEREPDLAGGMGATLLPGECRDDFLNVPLDATNLVANNMFSSGTGPVSLRVWPRGIDWSNAPTLLASQANVSQSLTLDQTAQPPLHPGQYVLHSCNLGPDPVDLTLQVNIMESGIPPVTNIYTSTNQLIIADAAVSDATLQVTNTGPIVSVDIGVKIQHPRVSDLVLSLVGPDGTRVLLDGNRGGDSTEGMGATALLTNTSYVDFSGGAQAVTNVFETGKPSGDITIDYNFFSYPDDMRVYYESNLLFDSGLVSFTGSTNLHYGPGSSTSFSVIMNQDGNPQTNTFWHYSVTATELQPLYVTFTEDANLTVTPIKFAPLPLTNNTFSPVDGSMQSGIYFLPEESLAKFTGKNPAGLWTLEILDTRAGATNPPPTLVSWQLALVLANTTPSPVVLGASSPATNLLGPGQLQWYAVDAPDWVSFATNSLVSSSAPVNVFFNAFAPPTGTNLGDAWLVSGATAGTWVLATNASPAFSPGLRYYLGIQNTNPVTATVSFMVSFDAGNMITLPSGGTYPNTNSGPLGAADFYRYVASSNAVRLQFEVTAPTSDVTLVARKGPPPPNLTSYQYISDNPGTNDELIVITDFSEPPTLAPGEWFLTVVNVTGAPAAYSVMATEFTDVGTNLVISESTLSDNSLCLTWSSLPGVHYFLQGKLNLTDSAWTNLSPTITATDVTTSFCLPEPVPFGFFRVSEGLVLVPALPIITSVAAQPNGTLLHWNAPTNNQFMVQWSTSLTPATWQSIPGPITSTTGSFQFLDDGSATSGFGVQRFYRLKQLP